MPDITLIQKGVEVQRLVFPITRRGEVSYVDFQVRNDLDSGVMLTPYSNDPDLEVIDFPKSMIKGEIKDARLRFSPKKDRKSPLGKDGSDNWGFEVLMV